MIGLAASAPEVVPASGLDPLSTGAYSFSHEGIGPLSPEESVELEDVVVAVPVPAADEAVEPDGVVPAFESVGGVDCAGVAVVAVGVED